MSDEHKSSKERGIRKVVEVKPKIKVIRELPPGAAVAERSVEAKDDIPDSSFEDNREIRHGGSPVLDRVGTVVAVGGTSRRIGDDEDERAFAGRQFYETQQGAMIDHEQGRSSGGNERKYTPLESSVPTSSQRVPVSGSGMLDRSENMLPENERMRQVEQEQHEQQYRHGEQQQQVRARRRYPWEA